MSAISVLHVGRTTLEKDMIPEPSFHLKGIENFQDSLCYTENELRAIYIEEFERICTIFNKYLLPLLINNYTNNSSGKSVVNWKLMNELYSANESGNYTNLEIKSSFFDFNFISGSSRMGSFNHYNIPPSWLLGTSSLEGICEIVNTQAPKRMSLNINIHYMRGCFYDQMFDTLRHELAHAIVYLYYETMISAITGERPKVMPHGKEWKNVARILGAKPYAKGKLGEEEKGEVKKSFSHYNLNKTLVDGKKVKARKKTRFKYVCSCNGGVHWFTANRHNKVMRQSVSYVCKKCKTKLIFVNEKKTVY